MTRRAPPGLVRGAGGERLPVVELLVGEWRASRDPLVLCTLLGSCVAVCLFDPVARAGGMNHVLLAGRSQSVAPGRAARFARDATELLVGALIEAGGRRSRLRAKVFGGGEVIAAMRGAGSPAARNAACVLEALAAERVPVVGSALGGGHGRRVWFRTDTGEVALRRVGAAVAGRPDPTR